jgi:hypothetical protein
MSIYKTCSVEKIIAQVYREFKPANSGWVDDAAEWIGDAIGIMKVYQSFSNLCKDINVVDYRAKLPCDIELLLGVQYGRTRLTQNGGIKNPSNKFKCSCEDINKCSCFNSMVCNEEESYTLNPNYINTSFKTGKLLIYYKGIEVDCNGLPFIIDDAVYRQAIVWYIMSMMLLRGFKHQTVTYEFAWNKWETFYPRAQNRFVMADVEDYDTFMKSWLGVIKPTNMQDTFFNNHIPDYSSNPAFDPGTQFENYPFID